MIHNDDGLQEPLIEELGSRAQPEVTRNASSKKRKRERNSDQGADAKKTKGKRHILNDDELDVSAGINLAFAHMDGQLLADYIAQRTKNFESNLSKIELEDLYIPAKVIRDTTNWDKPRSTDNLPGFLEKFSQNPTKLWSASKKYGSPHTIIVTGAGLRAAQLVRVLKKFPTKDVAVAKLFAKHIKIKDAIKFLRSTRVGIAVGTPARLNDLTEDGALAIDKLERIVIDASHMDQKNRGTLEMKDTQVPLVQWLNRSDIKMRLNQEVNGVDLLFY